MKKASPVQRPAAKPYAAAAHVTALVFLTVIVYFNSLNGAFVFDDDQIVLHNPQLTNVRTLADALQIDVGGRGLLFVSYALNHYWNGFEPYSYHVVNVTLHALNVILVYFLIRALSGSALAAFSGAAIFSVHPLFTGAVSYVAGRSSVLCAVFYFAAILFFLKGRLWIILAGVCGLLAWHVKQEAITLPVFLAGVVWLRSEKKNWKAIAGLLIAPLLGLFLLKDQIRELYSTVTTNKVLVAAGFESVLAPADYFRTYIGSIGAYFLPRFAFPVSLNADPMIRPVTHSFSLWFFIGVIALAFLGALALKYARSEPLLSVGATAILLSPLTAYALSPLADVVQEHRAYIPGLGIAIIAAWCSQKLRSQAGRIAMVVLVALFSVMTISRNRVWANSVTLWQDVTEKSPDKPRAHFNLGAAYQTTGRPAQALAEYKRTLELNPNLYAAYSNIAALQIDSGQLDDAEKTLLKVAALAPGYIDPLINLGVLYLRRREPDKAIAAAKQALSSDPNSFDAEFNLAEGLTQKEEFAAAVEHYQKSIYLRPDIPALRLNLLAANIRAGENAAAKELFNDLMKTQPSSQVIRAAADAHHDLGVSHLRHGDSARAAAEFQTTLQFMPDHGPASLNLSLVYQTRGDRTAARQVLQNFVNRSGTADPSLVAQAQQRLKEILDKPE